MEIIIHRINTVSELSKVHNYHGVELDLRNGENGKIIIHHNPFEKGDSFEDYLKEYRHGTMILNIKSEGIERCVLDLIRKYNVKYYFFLDLSFPAIKMLSDEGEKNIAIRFSEFEGLDTLELMRGRVDWVWIDTFSRNPLTPESFKRIKDLGYRVCFVSPELQGQPEKIDLYIREINKQDYAIDAVCTNLEAAYKWECILGR